MDINQIKEIPIVDYLQWIDHQPNARRGQSVWYEAFWRGGNNPKNVHVDVKNNQWFDYKEAVGGGVIDLAMKINHCDKHQAMLELTRLAINHNYKPTPKKYVPALDRYDTTESGIIIREVRDIFYYPIKNYIQERGISLEVASRYCKEIRYSFGSDGSLAFGLGFPLSNGGWAIRNKNFKGCTRQDISVFKHGNPDDCVLVFEGFFDFLSFVELYGNPTLFIICLNSVSNLKKALPYFERTKRIYLCLDNDETGHKTVADISAIYGAKVIDKSNHYSPFKDFNEYLMNTKNGNQDKE